MKTYTYRFADYTKSDVTVSDELYELLTEMDKQERYGNRKESRRHVSLDNLVSLGIEPNVLDKYDCGEMFSNLQDDTLFEAVERLNAKQKGLLKNVFCERRKLKEIAEEERVSPQVMSWRLRTILSQLRIKK